MNNNSHKISSKFSLQRWIVWTTTILFVVILIIEFARLHQYTNLIIEAVRHIDVLGLLSLNQLSKENSGWLLDVTDSQLSIISIIIAFFSVILTFAAFYIQYSFNLRQKTDLSNERFENQFFHLLDVYRDICTSTHIPNVGSGKIAFHYMFYEYKAIYNKIIEKRLLPSSDPLKTNQLAFMIFIDGVSEDFIPDFPGINQKHLKDFRDELLALQEKSEKNEEQIKGSGVKYIRDYKGRCIKYFDGHRLRLLHYFNYIQLIIKHIEQADNRFSGENLAMVDYLCSEMSEHELGLLYSYYHYRIPNERYRPYYQAIFNKISNNRRFLFDNKLFIM